MIGGPPVFLPPLSQHAVPPAPQAQRPAPQPAALRGYTPPRLAAPAARRPAEPPPAPRVARGVRGSEPTPSPLAIPTPEELGVAPAARPASPAKPPDPLDWSAARRQLADVGAIRFGLENLPGGKVRFSCWLPGDGDSPRLVQADAPSEAEAVRLCLERARRAPVGKP